MIFNRYEMLQFCTRCPDEGGTGARGGCGFQWKAPDTRTQLISLSFFGVVIVGVGGFHQAYVVAVAAGQSCGAHTARAGVRVGGVDGSGCVWLAAIGNLYFN